MERIVSARLMFHLESHNLLSPLQSGFRKSEIDHKQSPSARDFYQRGFCQETVDFTLSCYSKARTPESTYRTLYLEHRELFSDYEPIFTDGSKSESHVGSAVVSLSTVITDALPISTSIYTAELHALRIALEHISLSCGKQFIIYTDSLSALQSIVSLHSSSHLILVDITYALANHLKKKDVSDFVGSQDMPE
ncbi:RNA-directed DNA polymerase from mobile element jockey [Trichonephila clavipes]|nr:RNA-directed DNA polymerase from mobile element jockey [Trichonephila clavipes]